MSSTGYVCHQRVWSPVGVRQPCALLASPLRKLMEGVLVMRSKARKEVLGSAPVMILRAIDHTRSRLVPLVSLRVAPIYTLML